jgi:hypothetical protein
VKKIYRSFDFPLAVERDEIARVLGYGVKEVPARAREVIDKAERTAKGLIATASAYRFLDNKEFEHSEYLSCLDKVVLCLVTIGGGLEEVVEKQKRNGDLSFALVLDGYGSAAAEAAADTAEAVIKKKIKSQGLKCSTRFSPGYGGWNVAEQKWIVPALDGEELGVRLTEGCMMVPRKSITFAMTYGESPVSMRDGEMCEVCEMENCRFRRVGEKKRPEIGGTK